MVLLLKRTYFPDGTNGTLEWEGQLICYTIELPWKLNAKGVSCIPEGEYVLRKRYSAKMQWHLEVTGVTGRSLILFHPANDAIRELRGCIGPVTKISGAGLGLMSRKAMGKLKQLVYAFIEQGVAVKLLIKS
jgi:hypothetical protein